MSTELAPQRVDLAAQLRALIVPPPGRAICEECGGTGSIGSEQRYTDPCTGGGEQQWRGYRPTNFCFVCDGSGVWPPLQQGGAA